MSEPLANRYELGAELGRGGMGVVYRGFDGLLGRDVAIKLVPHGERDARFVAEARRSAQVRHPNVIEIFDAGSTPEVFFLVMELLVGIPLDQRIQQNERLPPEEAVAIALAICAGLGAAHALGIVHRDVKPANVFLLANGGVKVLDFGIAKQLDAATTQTATGMIVGTHAYMAPEQIRGTKIDARADLYALGVLLFEALTGRLPFLGETPATILHEHLDVPAPRVSTLVSVPPRLDRLVALLLAKDAADRPHDAASVHALLRASLEPDEDRSALVFDEPEGDVHLELAELPRHPTQPPAPSANVLRAFDPQPVALEAPPPHANLAIVSPEISKRIAAYSGGALAMDIIVFHASALPIVCLGLLTLGGCVMYAAATWRPR